ncbi:MAG: error-prone DNA polymerase [Hyphomonadaceae bacterium]|nr:error-prone DNA polymerase [Hyphomonadaceae bacterium]
MRTWKALRTVSSSMTTEGRLAQNKKRTYSPGTEVPMTAFAELCVTTNFSFLRAGSHPEEMVEKAKMLGLAGLGVADRNTLAGVVRAHMAAKEQGLRLLVGARLVFADAPDVMVYPQDRAAYAQLTRLLTRGNLRAPKGECWLRFADFLEHAEGLRAIAIPPLPCGEGAGGEGRANASGTCVSERPSSPGPSPARGEGRLAPYLAAIREAAGQVWLAAPMRFDGEDKRRLRELKALAQETGARLLATTEPLMHAPERRALLDVVTCIREKTTLAQAGALLAKNAERHLKAPAEIARLYADAPDAVAESLRFLEGVHFSMDDLRYEYPEETAEGFADPQQALEALTWAGALKRYPQGAPAKVDAALRRELSIVAKLKFAPYFLTVADIVRFARSGFDKDGNVIDPILCQGRGSAANSAICYCLGVTEVNPAENELLFDRFVSEERNEPPDIDIDFEHERREEVIQYIYKKYGRDRAGLSAVVTCYRGRSAIRETAKTFGYSEDRINALSKALHWWSDGVTERDLQQQGLDVSDPHLRACVTLARDLHGFPRHLSQHVGGFVITREKLHDVVPIQNAAMEDRTVIEWNKDDLEALGLLKVDVLGLGMLSCLKKALDMMAAHYPDWRTLLPLPSRGGGGDLSIFWPPDDPRVYAMLHRADSVGVFQVESRAQMSMLPRLRPKNFYDLVIEVAIVRPGPIQGGMVHPYLRRRQGLEKVFYPSKALEDVLKRTLGVTLFQEQAMQIAIVGAGFTPPEADKLRRAMATFKRVGTIHQLKAKFIDGMIANGYAREFAEASFRQIEGFGEYGFPESHAASFALLVYASCWLKCHYPDVFAAALLNAQPMGFYAPAQIVRDAIEHGVEVRGIDVNQSAWDNTLEPGPRAGLRLHPRHREMESDIRSTHALRLGFRQAKGLQRAEMEQLVARRGWGYDSVRDVWLRSGLPASTIERLADIDAFRSLGLDRRDALWAARGLNRVGGQEDLPLFAEAALPSSLAEERLGEEGRSDTQASERLQRDRCNDPEVGSSNDPALDRLPAPHPPAPSPQGGGGGDFQLPSMPLGEHIVEDYRTLGLSLKAHPCALLRANLDKGRAIRAELLQEIGNGRRVRVSGLVLVRQRPGTASGVIFMTLEDETGIANIVVWPKLFERFRAEVLGGRLVAIDGPVQSESGVIHVIAERVLDWTSLLAKLSACGPDIDATTPNDEPKKGGPGGSWRGDPQRHLRNVRINLSVSGAAEAMPKGRNFH